MYVRYNLKLVALDKENMHKLSVCIIIVTRITFIVQ